MVVVVIVVAAAAAAAAAAAVVVVAVAFIGGISCLISIKTIRFLKTFYLNSKESRLFEYTRS